MNNATFNTKKLIEDVGVKLRTNRVVPVGVTTSYPVPIQLEENGAKVLYMVFFNFSIKLIKPTDPKESLVYAPFQKIIISYPELNIISVQRVTSANFGIKWDDSEAVGKIVSDPKYLGEAGFKQLDRFYELYDHILPLYLSKPAIIDHSLKLEINEFLTLFNYFGNSPLLPYYRSLNPDFFQWLYDNSK